MTNNSSENKNVEYITETSTPKQRVLNDSENITLQIKEEQLNIAKKWIQTGEAKIYREVFTEEKNFTVPVNREELVIEKKIFNTVASEQKDASAEIIRIPLSEEQIELIKHRVTLEDVSIYKHQVEDIKHIEETLKREELKVKISGRSETNKKLH